MEELFYLPPRAQAPVIDYGVAIGNRSRLAKRGAHNWKLTARPNRRRSSRFCRVIDFSPIDNHPDVGCQSHSDWYRPKLDHGHALRGRYSPTQRIGRRFFAPTAEFNLQLHYRSCAAYRSMPHFPRLLQCSHSHGDQCAPSNYCHVSIS